MALHRFMVMAMEIGVLEPAQPPHGFAFPRDLEAIGKAREAEGR